MTELRTAYTTTPLPCFGLEFSRQADVCKACPHSGPCRTAMGVRCDRVPLLKARVALTGSDERLPAGETGLAAAYAAAYARVFDKTADRLDAATETNVLETAKELGILPSLFVQAAMVGHSISSPERKFQARFLTGPAAVKRAKFYRKEASRRFGVYDADTLGRLSGSERRVDLSRDMFDAERLAGKWIVSSALSLMDHSLRGLFRSRELALNPHWLRIEPAYVKWRQESPRPTAAEIEQRRVVDNIDPASLGELHAIRSAQLITVAGAVLADCGYDARDFEVPDEPVTKALTFWKALATAAQQAAFFLGEGTRARAVHVEPRTPRN